MENSKRIHIKSNGIYYTPKKIAEFLVKPLIKRTTQTIFDPAYGEGSLLLAAEKVYKEKVTNYSRKNVNKRFYGVKKCYTI